MKRAVLKWGSVFCAALFLARTPGMLDGDGEYKAISLMLLAFTFILAAGYAATWARPIEADHEDAPSE